MILRLSDFLNENTTNINSYSKYLDQIIPMTSGKQREWYEWQRRSAIEVEIHSPESVISELTQEWARKKLRVKDCYKNAAQVMNLDPEIKYVEGIMMLWNSIPIEHAWNSYKGKHFDATSHLWDPSKEKSSHIQLIELGYGSLWEVLEETGVYGEIPSYLFRKGRIT